MPQPPVGVDAPDGGVGVRVGAARTRAHSSRSSGSDTRPAKSLSRPAWLGSAAAAAEMSAAWAGDRSPRRNALSTAGWSGSRCEVSNAFFACPVGVPPRRANSSAADRVPPLRWWVPAIRRAGRAQPLRGVQHRPQLAGGRPGHRIRIQPIDQNGQPIPDLDRILEHVSESRRGL
jgi:hypothetical protein